MVVAIIFQVDLLQTHDTKRIYLSPNPSKLSAQMLFFYKDNKGKCLVMQITANIEVFVKSTEL
jgi:hypothetical protein